MTVQISQISQKDLEKMKSIKSLIESRRHMYGSVTVRTVLTREPGELKTTITLFEARHRADPAPEDQTYEYPYCTLAIRTISLDDLKEAVDDLVIRGRLKIEGVTELDATGSFSGLNYYEYVASKDEIFKLDWPANVFTFDPRNKVGLPREPFAAPDAPLYPGPWEVVRLWTGLDVSRNNIFQGCILFILPNFSARIEQLRLATGGLDLKVSVRETDRKNIVGKLFCEKFGEQVIQKNIEFDSDSITVPIGFIPDYWQVYLLSKADGTIIDFRKVHASWPSLPSGVVVDLGPADIHEILSRGENDQIEFKVEVSSKQDEFLETLVAFANTRGGTVFVGVNDNGKVVGIYDQKFDELVQNLVRGRCEPSPDISIERKEFDGKPIYLVRVDEGMEMEKPYNLRDRGFFVRAGSTDRLASRIEMDQMYSTRQPNPSERKALW